MTDYVGLYAWRVLAKKAKPLLDLPQKVKLVETSKRKLKLATRASKVDIATCTLSQMPISIMYQDHLFKGAS